VSRTAYLGTSEFAARVLRTLAESRHRPVLVVTPPDRRKGRGRRASPPPAAEAARDLGIELLQTADVNDPGAVERLGAAAPGVVAVCAFGQLIREPLLSSAEMLNVHPSLLPRWRGAAPIERAIMAGDAVTGVCVMRLTAGLDSGPVALCQEIGIDPGEDFGGLSERLAGAGGRLLVRALDLRERGELAFSEQDEGAVTYAEKIDPGERRLSAAEPAAELERRVRALNPHVGTYLEIGDGDRLGVRRAAAAPGTDLDAGELAGRDGTLLLGTGDGALSLELVQSPGGRPLPAADWLRGNTPPDRIPVP
jgi:methionyl-tRNA formyltransferase